MNTFKYRVYHDEAQCSKADRAHPALTDDQLDHEYDSIDTEFHLYLCTKNTSVPYDCSRFAQGGVVIAVRGFTSEAEADQFITEFPEWLKRKLGSSSFCPAVVKVSE